MSNDPGDVPNSTPTRQVYCEDALAWLNQSAALPNTSLIASLPDISEFSNHSLAEWKTWFISTAELIFSRTPDSGVTVFFQSDIKYEGTWVDKSFLIQQAAEQSGTHLLWHKIASRIQPGQTSFGRPGYSHMLCFSKVLRLDPAMSTPDILPDLGDKTWVRGMGLAACLSIAKFIRNQTDSTTIINPFCGQGSMLAAANWVGLHAVGIERSKKRADRAAALTISADGDRWIEPKFSRP